MNIKFVPIVPEGPVTQGSLEKYTVYKILSDGASWLRCLNGFLCLNTGQFLTLDKFNELSLVHSIDGRLEFTR